MKLNDITAFKVHTFEPPSSQESVEEFTATYKNVPDEYLDLISSATEIELTHDNDAYLRIYGASDAIEMDEGYSISANLEGAITIGDDGNSRAVFYWHGDEGVGLYVCDYNALFPEEVTFVSPSLTLLLQDGVGAENLLLD